MINKIFSITAIAAAIALASLACGGGGAAVKTLTLADGSKYEGQVNKDGAPHGKGAMTYNTKWDGKSYDPYPVEYTGEWKDGKQDGQGTMTYGGYVRFYAKGCKYVGQWKDHRIHGHGTMTWPDGAKYEGEWDCCDMPGGQGTLTLANGKKYSGRWGYAEYPGFIELYDSKGKVILKVYGIDWNKGKFPKK